MRDNDPLVAAEKMMQVRFEDNGIEQPNKIALREKAVIIGKHAKSKLQQEAGAEVIELALELD